MSKFKKDLAVDVLSAARERISEVFDHFEQICVSFSAGKDSTVLLSLAAHEARRRKRRIGVLFVDLEAQYRCTIAHAKFCFDFYSDVIDPYWICLPLSLRNAVSQFQPQWKCWDAQRVEHWVREPHPTAIRDPAHFPFFMDGMEFEDFVEKFALWYGRQNPAAILVAIRADESLNRFRALILKKEKWRHHCWSTQIRKGIFKIYPLYDWKVADIWTYSFQSGLPQNPIYELMQKAGVPIRLQRVCQPYGDGQRRGLWLFHLLEPETWGRIVARVMGANSGALYARESGNINGLRKIVKPEGLSWKSYTIALLVALPDPIRIHYENKIWVFLNWWQKNGYPAGIPDEADPKDEASRRKPSWRRVCKAILRNDYWCTSLSFSQHKSHKYEAYLTLMAKRRGKWKLT